MFFQSIQKSILAICILESLTCSSMLSACCWKCLIASRDYCSLADVGPSPTNMDYVKVGCEFDEDMLITPQWASLCSPAGRGKQSTAGVSVWQVHHSVIKGHIITSNSARMTIACLNSLLPIMMNTKEIALGLLPAFLSMNIYDCSALFK